MGPLRKLNSVKVAGLPFFLLVLFLLAVLWISYRHFFMGNPHAQYSALADAMLSGRLDVDPLLLKRYGLSLMDFTIVETKAYWPLAPLPAVLLLPWALLGLAGGAAETVLHLVAIWLVLALGFLFGRRSGLSQADSAWMALAVGFGSVLLGATYLIGPWYMAQTMSVMFVMAGLVEYRGKNRAWVIGLACALALACRPLAGAALAVFYGLSILFSEGVSRKAAVRAALFGLPVLGAGLLLAGYNMARFGDPADAGYRFSYYVRNVPLYLISRRELTGLFHWSYMPENFYDYFLRMPVYRNYLLGASPVSLSVLLISPAFFFVATLRKLNAEQWAAVLTSVLFTAILLAFYTSGYVQFGGRYLNDVLPLMFLLLVGAVTKRGGLSGTMKAVIAASVCLNMLLAQSSQF